MNPLGLNRVQPGAFRGQQARQYAHALAGLLDRLIVATHPGANRLTLVPRGVIPDQHESWDRLRCKLFAARLQEVDGDSTDGTPIDKTQEHLISKLGTATQQHSIAGQCFWINVLFASFQFLQPSFVSSIYPAMLIGLSQPAPPNPLVYMQKATWQQLGIEHNSKCFIGRIHGDLHTGNVICSSTSQQIPHIIDFDQSMEDGVPFFDLAYLEFDIMRHVLAVEQEGNRRNWISLLDVSMAKIEGGEQNLPWDADRAWGLIQPIRQGVQRLLASAREDASGREDYEIVWWLSTVAAGLNFARKGDQTRSRFERMAGLLYAAYGLARILEIFGVKESMTEQTSFVPWLQKEE